MPNALLASAGTDVVVHHLSEKRSPIELYRRVPHSAPIRCCASVFNQSILYTGQYDAAVRALRFPLDRRDRQLPRFPQGATMARWR